VADAFAGDLAFELGEREQDIERQSPHAGRCIERLRYRDETRLPSIKPFDDLGEVGKAAGQAIDLVDNDNIDLPRIDISKQGLDTGPLQVAAREPAVVIAVRDQRPAFMALAEYVSLAGLALGIE